MTNVTELAYQLKFRTEWQEVPRPIEEDEYVAYIKLGIQQQYILTSRPGLYKEELLSESLTGDVIYAETFTIDETEYILLSAQIYFLQKVQTMVNSRVGYTTDAFSVTNADKPYLFISDTLKGLKKDRAIIHYKMEGSM